MMEECVNPHVVVIVLFLHFGGATAQQPLGGIRGSSHLFFPPQ
jgi:hypothetical protein